MVMHRAVNAAILGSIPSATAMTVKGDNMTIGVYSIVCKATDSIYIGSSNNIELRWKAHKNHLSKGIHVNRYLQRAYDKYGLSDFNFTIIEECSEDRLIEREQYYIDFQISIKRTLFNTALNVKYPTKGFKYSLESKNLLSSKLKSNKNAVNQKGYMFIDPYGNIVHIVNLNAYCTENDLNVSAMWLVHKGLKKSYKGYTKVE